MVKDDFPEGSRESYIFKEIRTCEKDKKPTRTLYKIHSGGTGAPYGDLDELADFMFFSTTKYYGDKRENHVKTSIFQCEIPAGYGSFEIDRSNHFHPDIGIILRHFENLSVEEERELNEKLAERIKKGDKYLDKKFSKWMEDLCLKKKSEKF